MRSRLLPRWLVYAILSTACWGTFGFLSKLGADKFGPADVQLLFTVGMVPLTIAAWFRVRGKLGMKPSGVICGLAIGILSTLAFLAYVAAMAKGSAMVIVPLTSLYPLPAMVLALLVLKERLNALQVVGVVFSIAAMLILAT